MIEKTLMEESKNHLLSERINRTSKNGWFIFLTIRREWSKI